MATSEENSHDEPAQPSAADFASQAKNPSLAS